MKKIKEYRLLFNTLVILFMFSVIYYFNKNVYELKSNLISLSVVLTGTGMLFISVMEGLKIITYRIRDIYFGTLGGLIINQFLIFLMFDFELGTKNSLQASALQFLITFVGIVLIGFIISRVFYATESNSKTILIHNVNDDEIDNLKRNLKKYKGRYQITEELSQKEDIEVILNKIEHYTNTSNLQILAYDLNEEIKEKILKVSFERDVKLTIIPKTKDILAQSCMPTYLIDKVFHQYDFGSQTFIERFIKRLIDFTASLIGLVLTSPIMAIVALAIKLEDKGPVFYKQVRLTKDAKEFNVLKFRSMVVDAEKNGPEVAKENDSRITKVGKVIRALRIDELPQLLNIIRGDMTIVGPRPERPETFKETIKEFPEFAYRLKVKGGLTGLAQVEGKYNTKLEDKLNLDLLYITNFSLILDFKIMVKTVQIIFSKEATEGF